MIHEDMAYILPNVSYIPSEHALDVELFKNEYCRSSFMAKLGKRQESAIRHYIEDMMERGKVIRDPQ